MANTFSKAGGGAVARSYLETGSPTLDDQAAGGWIYEERRLSLRSERTGFVDGGDGLAQHASFSDQLPADPRIDRESLDRLAGSVGASHTDLHR
jgi:hypothetical protein